MPISYLGLTGAVLNFFGGAFLVYDSLRPRSKNFAAAGAKEFAEEQQKRLREGKKALYETHDNKPLATELQWTVWLGQRSLQWTWVGFLLMSLGFLLDVFNRIFYPGS
jgi:hypothetical protein